LRKNIPLTTTKLSTSSDGSTVLETFDFRLEFAFDDFASWIADRLDIHPVYGRIIEDMQPFEFEWNGAVFKADWSDQLGCFIGTVDDQQEALKQMQIALSS
jgi:hypothetical protein